MECLEKYLYIECSVAINHNDCLLLLPHCKHILLCNNKVRSHYGLLTTANDAKHSFLEKRSKNKKKWFFCVTEIINEWNVDGMKQQQHQLISKILEEKVILIRIISIFRFISTYAHSTILCKIRTKYNNKHSSGDYLHFYGYKRLKGKTIVGLCLQLNRELYVNNIIPRNALQMLKYEKREKERKKSGSTDK